MVCGAQHTELIYIRSQIPPLRHDTAVPSVGMTSL